MPKHSRETYLLGLRDSYLSDARASGMTEDESREAVDRIDEVVRTMVDIIKRGGGSTPGQA